jgi:hypothetical protein
MNSVTIVEVLRNCIANVPGIRTLLRVSSAANALKVILYTDAEYVGKDDFYSLPGIVLRMDDDASTLRGSDSNTVDVEITIVDSVMAKSGSAAINCMKIRDLLKTLFKDNHIVINNQATALGKTLKVRDSEWVSSVSFKEKTQGTERLHKIICTLKLIVGD